MPSYDNHMRTGIRSSSTADPRRLEEDISEKVRRLDPESTPIQWISEKLGRGPTPKSHKIQSIMYDSFDHYDRGTQTYLGTAGEKRFCRLKVEQLSRPTTGPAYMPYHPQDSFYVAATGQNVMVVMTPDARYEPNEGSPITLTTNLTGNTTTATLPGEVVVMNIEPAPMRTFTQSSIIYKGRTIRESQKIGGLSKQRDVWYDCNFVEHKEAILAFTEDQKKWVKTKGSMPDFTTQQKETLDEFKKDVEMTLLFGERSVDYSNPQRPLRTMRGLLNHITTNVSVYNPFSTLDFEDLTLNFMEEQAFRYMPNGSQKVMMCGRKLLTNFNKAFKEFRRHDTGDKAVAPGLNISTYTMPGGYTLKLVRNDILRGDLEHWGIVMDPAEAEMRIVKDYESRPWSLADERDIKYMVEWQGTVAWNRPEAHAILRTA